MVTELYFGVVNKILSILQFEIFLDKPAGGAYKALEMKYSIPSNSVMSTVIKRTDGGRY